MGWYVVFKEGNETLTQTAEDRDEAILVACDVYLRGHLVLSIGPLGRGAVPTTKLRDTNCRTSSESGQTKNVGNNRVPLGVVSRLRMTTLLAFIEAHKDGRSCE